MMTRNAHELNLRRQLGGRNAARLCAKLAAVVLAVSVGASRAEAEYDVVVYGSTPAALTAAIEAERHGKSAVVVCPETRIGGLTTGGLGATDIGNKAAFGGQALQFPGRSIAARCSSTPRTKATSWRRPASRTTSGTRRTRSTARR